MNPVAMQGCGNTFLLDDLLSKKNDEDNPLKCIEIGDDKALNEVLVNLIQNHFQLNKTTQTENTQSDNTQYVPDGFLFLLPSENADVRMKYFDIDRFTLEPYLCDMCGNGIRCLSRYFFDSYNSLAHIQVETDDGVKAVIIKGDQVEVNMGPPREFSLVDPDRELYFVNTSLAHVVMFLDAFDIENKYHLNMIRSIGSDVAWDGKLAEKVGHPEGLHLNAVKVYSPHAISIVTFEPGVDDLTLACGTGATVAAYVSAQVKGGMYPIFVQNRGGTLKIEERNSSLRMTGPAEYIRNGVGEGTINLVKVVTMEK